MPTHAQPNGAASDRRSILVIAHPGHELRVHRWLETAQPTVCILTDGSGRTNRPRLDSTTRVLSAAGAIPGPIYGRFSDANLYASVLNLDHDPFIHLVESLAAMLIRDNIDFIAGDAEEGYNPAHDICRLVINAAARIATKTSAKQIANYDFTLTGPAGRCPEALRTHALWLDLDESSFARKLSAARRYPELQAEVESALNGVDNESFRNNPDLARRARSAFGMTDTKDFRKECLRPVNLMTRTSLTDDVPFYEIYGQRQVEAGHYSRVLRLRDHVLPLAAALDAQVARSF